MSATDPFTAASPTYRAAIRHPHKTGNPLEVQRPALNWGLIMGVLGCAVFWFSLCLSIRPALSLLDSLRFGG